VLELMNIEALKVGEARRREVALETMRDVHAAADHHYREATGNAIVALGQRLAGGFAAPQPKSPAAEPKLQTSVGDCI